MSHTEMHQQLHVHREIKPEMMMKSLIGAAMFLLIYYNWRYLLINWKLDFVVSLDGGVSRWRFMDGVYSDLYLIDFLWIDWNILFIILAWLVCLSYMSMDGIKWKQLTKLR